MPSSSPRPRPKPAAKSASTSASGAAGGSPQTPLPKGQRREVARERARALREAELRKQRRTRIALISVSLVLVLALVAVIAVAVGRHSSSAQASGSRPPGVSASNAIATGKASAPHTVQIYQDYQCPYCKAFEASANTWLEEQRDAGKLRLDFHPIAFLDASSSGNEYSTRAANAAACVAGDADVNFSAWNDAMYAQQPEEGGDGRTDSQLIAVAKKQGAGAAVGRCIVSKKYEGWVKKETSTAMSSSGAGITGTPTILVDGKQVSGSGGTVPSLAQVKAALGMSGA